MTFRYPHLVVASLFIFFSLNARAGRIAHSFPQETVLRTLYTDIVCKPSGYVSIRVNLINLETTATRPRSVKLTLLDEWVKVSLDIRNRNQSALGRGWFIVDPSDPNSGFIRAETASEDANPGVPLPQGVAPRLSHPVLTTTLAAGESKTVYFSVRVGLSPANGLVVENTGPGGSNLCEANGFAYAKPDTARGTCGTSTDDNQLCRMSFQYRTRLDVEPTDDKGAIMAAMTLLPGICCAPGANEPVEIQALNGGRPF